MADSYGFVPTLAGGNAPPNTAVVLAALNCPSVLAKRADAMALRLRELGILNTRANNYRIGGVIRDQSALIEQTSAIFGGEIPVIIVNGCAKTNASVEEVVAEMRRGT